MDTYTRKLSVRRTDIVSKGERCEKHCIIIIIIIILLVVVVGRIQNTTHCVQFHYLYRRLWTLVVSITHSTATLRPYVTLTFGVVAVARCVAQCQQLLKLSTYRSQIEISDILTLLNVHSKDRDCPSARYAAVDSLFRVMIC